MPHCQVYLSRDATRLSSDASVVSTRYCRDILIMKKRVKTTYNCLDLAVVDSEGIKPSLSELGKCFFATKSPCQRATETLNFNSRRYLRQLETQCFQQPGVPSNSTPGFTPLPITSAQNKH